MEQLLSDSESAHPAASFDRLVQVFSKFNEVRNRPAGTVDDDDVNDDDEAVL